MELKSSACDARSPEMLHINIDCQDLGFLYLMHLPKMQGLSTMLSSPHHCGLTILIIAQCVWGRKKFLIIDRMHQIWIRIFVPMDWFNYNSLF